MRPKKPKKVNVNDQGHMCPTCGDVKPQDDINSQGTCNACQED